MRPIDREYTEHPFLGSRRTCEYLRSQGHAVNRKRVRQSYGAMGLEAIYRKPIVPPDDLFRSIWPD